MLTYFKLCTTQIIQGHIRSFIGKPCIPGAGARLHDNMSDPPFLHSAIVTLEWKCFIIEYNWFSGAEQSETKSKYYKQLKP